MKLYRANFPSLETAPEQTCKSSQLTSCEQGFYIYMFQEQLSAIFFLILLCSLFDPKESPPVIGKTPIDFNAS